MLIKLQIRDYGLAEKMSAGRAIGMEIMLNYTSAIRLKFYFGWNYYITILKFSKSWDESHFYSTKYYSYIFKSVLLVV